MAHNPTTGPITTRDLVVCYCGIPLARKVGPNTYEIVKNNHRDNIVIQADVRNGSINCKTCGFCITHATVTKTLPMSYVVVPKTESKE